jgi:putative phage-type endonuclease
MSPCSRAEVIMADGAFTTLGSSRDRERWLQLRQSGIGASEIAAVLGESPWLSAIELYAQKIGQAPAREEEPEWIYWGNRLEPAIVAGYQDRTGRPVEHQSALLRSSAHPWAMCTLDALTTDGRDGDPWPLEIKNVGVTKAHEWEDGPPRHYALQLQHQLLVTGAPRATAAALIGGQRLVWCDVERDEIEIRRIIHAGRIFWTECVEKGICPKPDGSDSAKRALGALYRDTPTPESFVHLPGTLIDADTELCEMKKTARVLHDRIAALENEIKAHIATAEHGVLPNGTVYSWREQSRAEHVVKASKFRVLRRHAPRAEKEG